MSARISLASFVYLIAEIVSLVSNATQLDTHPVVLVCCEAIEEWFDFLRLFPLTDLILICDAEERGRNLGEPFRFDDSDLVHILL